MSRVAKTLNKETFPDIAAQLKLGRLNSYAALLAFASNAINVVTPIKQVFIDRGAAATVTDDLQDKIDALVAAGGRGFTGRGTRIGSNAAIAEAMRACMPQVRVLDGIMSIVLKANLGLMAEWKAAKRIPLGPTVPEEPEASAAVAATATPGNSVA